MLQIINLFCRCSLIKHLAAGKLPYRYIFLKVNGHFIELIFSAFALSKIFSVASTINEVFSVFDVVAKQIKTK